jgi:uncharacterized protein with PQ loop repeat
MFTNDSGQDAQIKIAYLTLPLPEAAKCISSDCWRSRTGNMDMQSIQMVAGSISSFMFITSHVPMLIKAFKTKNMHSYSLSNLLLTNVGNIIYWLYISSLPIGPIWVMHSFYTLTSLLMLTWYLRYEYASAKHTLSKGQ